MPPVFGTTRTSESIPICDMRSHVYSRCQNVVTQEPRTLGSTELYQRIAFAHHPRIFTISTNKRLYLKDCRVRHERCFRDSSNRYDRRPPQERMCHFPSTISSPTSKCILQTYIALFTVRTSPLSWGIFACRGNTCSIGRITSGSFRHLNLTYSPERRTVMTRKDAKKSYRRCYHGLGSRRSSVRPCFRFKRPS